MQHFKHIIKLTLFLISTASFAHTYTGKLEVLVVDYFDKNKSIQVYQLHEGQDIYVLEFPPNLDTSKLETGASIIVEGTETEGIKDKIIKVESILKNRAAPKPLKTAVDTRKILALLVNFSNIKATTTVSVENVDAMLYKNLRSSQNNFLLSSFNQISLIADANNDGKSDIYTVNLNYDAQNCDYSKWATDAKNAATQAGVNLSLYKHFMFILPKSVKCQWGGIGTLGCASTCNTWVKGYDANQVYSQLIYTHELGHNMGMHHAASDLNNDGTTDAEYGDAACTMGTGDYQYYKEVNAPHRDQMHWFDAFPNNIKTVTGEGQYILSSLEAGTKNGLLALRFKKNANETYYVSYRKNIGVFGPGTPNYLDKISIHRTRTGDTHTYFIKTLDIGEVFSDPTSQVHLTATSVGGNSAVVTVGRPVPITPVLTACTYSSARANINCIAPKGGMLTLGNSIARLYSGTSCSFNGKIYNSPGTGSLTDTNYITTSGVTNTIVGCNVALCSSLQCNGVKTNSVPIVRG